MRSDYSGGGLEYNFGFITSNHSPHDLFWTWYFRVFSIGEIRTIFYDLLVRVCFGSSGGDAEARTVKTTVKLVVATARQNHMGGPCGPGSSMALP